MMKRFLPMTTGLLLALSLCVTALAGILWTLGTTPDVMLAMMRRFAPSEVSRLPDAEYPAMADMITGYLAGEVDAFQHTFALDGVAYVAFQPHEQQHMADCRALFRLDRTVLIASGLLSAVLLIAALAWKKRRVWRGAAVGLGGVMAAVTVIAVAAMVDFERLFVLFHRLSFSNDLWLLNPRTDLLIRLMPTEFFTTYAAILGIGWLALMALMLLGAVILYKRGKQA